MSQNDQIYQIVKLKYKINVNIGQLCAQQAEIQYILKISMVPYIACTAASHKFPKKLWKIEKKFLMSLLASRIKVV